jgi:DNA polymerase-1
MTNKKNTKKLFLLDAMALIYRAYYAFSKSPRINSKGLNTSAIFGFANTLLELFKKEKPDYLGVAFDTHAPTVRHDSFADYKANREKMPEDLSKSIPYIYEFLKRMGIPILEVDGYEADDVIGTLAKQGEKEGFEVYMVTPDKDYGQLVSDNIFMYKPARMGNEVQILGVKEITEKWDLERPEQFIDILGLWGDAVDNIPGIPGIGEKRAKELIKTYGSIENLIANAHQLKGKMKENVIQYAEQGLKSKDLATIITDVPIDFEAHKLKYSSPDYEALKELFAELEFKQVENRYFEFFKKKDEGIQGSFFAIAEEEISGKKSIKTENPEYILVQNPQDRKRLINILQAQKAFCFDTETTHIDPNLAELVGISFSFRAKQAFYVPFPDNYDAAVGLLSEFKPLLENPAITKVGQNLKYDMDVLHWYEIDVKGKIFDTMIAHYLIRPETKHNLDVLAMHYLDYQTVSYSELFDPKDKIKDIRKVDIDHLKDYACEDADITWQLKEILSKELMKYGVSEVFEKIETPLVPVLTAIENTGVRIDVDYLKTLSGEAQNDIESLENEIYRLAGETFNIASPKQLGIILFEKLKITDKPKLTKTKQYSTGEEILVKLKDKHSIVEAVLEYRGLAKLKSTYLDALPKLINPRTGKIHTSYNQAVTATGRLSSNNPNLQNIPVRTGRGRKIRKAFIPSDKGKILLAADYSQIELRIFASMSEEPNMIKAFNQGIDIHRATAARVFGIDVQEVSKEQRSKAKMVNFGIIYGISAFGLADRLNISRKEAKIIMEQYFEKYPGIKDYMNHSIEFAKEHGYVETLLGRRRYLRDINSANSIVRNFAERNAINAPVQGSAADMIKIAMNKVYAELRSNGLKSRMIMQVHDELVLDVVREEAKQVRKIVNHSMVNALPLKVPVIVDMKLGENWLEAH